jgi:glycosyltransferase involved in cell wall biosynthesis
VQHTALGTHITFTGLRSDVPRLLSALDVFVMPSRWEGLPMALLEAMASRKPVVVTPVGGIPSVIRHDSNGLVVPPESPALLAQAITQMLTQPDLRERLASQAQQEAMAHYDVGRVVQAYEGMYQTALGL